VLISPASGAGRPTFEDLLEAAPDAMLGVDHDSVIRFVNRQVERMFGYESAKLVGERIETLVPERLALVHVGHTDRYLADPKTRAMGAGLELTGRRRDGSEFPVEISLSSLKTPDGLVVLAAVRDITDRKLAEKELREAEIAVRALNARAATWEANEQFKNAFEHAPIGMALVGADGDILRANGQLCRLLGLVDIDAAPLKFATLVHPADRSATARGFESLLAGDIASYQEEHGLQHSNGDVVRVMLSASLVHGAPGWPLHFIIQCEDLTAVKHAEAMLLYRVFHDALTGLPNRTLVADRIEHALARSERDSSLVAVLFVDLDQFKVVNDSLGHDAGDEVLVEVATRLVSMLRRGDTAGRLGGDEFVVVCEGLADEDKVPPIAARIARVLAPAFSVAGREVTITASIGVALAQGNSSNTADLLRDSDVAMYRAKLLGRNRSEVFDKSMRLRAVARLDTENGVRRALDRGEFELFYQPMIDLSTGALTGFEALSRWNHPKLGLLGPSEFIPIAEDLGLIVPFGAWVLEEGCREAAQWASTHPGLLLAVNLSPRQVADPGLVEIVETTLAQTGLDPMDLCLELTESALIVASDTTIDALATLRRRGVQVSIDDFGTGYASLTYLIKFHPDILKVDKSFVERLGLDRESTAVVEAVVSLAHRLDLTAVAEGVETARQVSLLRELHCDQAQGFLLAKPGSVQVARGLLGDVEHPWQPDMNGPTHGGTVHPWNGGGPLLT
jgi:diguanylate cyclase (GGDEF)-like protein/PAS domain S-box-containing protein